MSTELSKEYVEELQRYALANNWKIPTFPAWWQTCCSLADLCRWALNRDTAAKNMAARCTEVERQLASAQNALSEVEETVQAFKKQQTCFNPEEQDS